MKKLLEYQLKITNLEYTINLLQWELKIAASTKSVDDLIKLISGYEEKLFKLKTDEEYGKLLSNVIESKDFASLEETEQRYIEKALVNYQQNNNIPMDFYNEYMETKNRANVAWREAKEKKDYELFKPYLSKIIELTKKYYRFIDPKSENLYDVMLNQYETGMTSDVIDKLFKELKEYLIPLIKDIAQKDTKEIKIEYTEKELINCATFLLDYIGFDMTRGALGIYPHGFTEKMCANDIRIAFGIENNPASFVTTIIHEGGHGIYEQNINSNLSKYENVCVDNLFALHESQSRFYENILGRNKNFWIPIYEDVKKLLKLNLSLDEFVEILNSIKCGKIRTQADEITYCLHIIVRYEIERALFNDEIDIDDLPQLWNEKMVKYLGVTIEDDAEGLMQDVHWSEGGFGYFPSYLLGTIYDGMFIKAIEKNLGNIDDLLKNGRIKEITKYLNDNVHQYGGAYTSAEIIKKVCGEEITTKPIINYFENKYRY